MLTEAPEAVHAGTNIGKLALHRTCSDSATQETVGAESRAITAGITPASIDDVTISQAQLRWLHRMQKVSLRQHSID